MNCKLCGFQDTSAFVVKNKSWEKKYYSCTKCKFVFADDNAVLNDTEQLERYQMHNNKIDDPTYRNYFKKFIKYAFPEVKKTAKILDFGSGPEPVLADVLREIGYNISIYDKFFADNESVFLDEYDVIISTEVFEHLEYPQEYITKLLKSLKQNGYLILMTCFNSNNFDEFSKWWYIQDPTHISFFAVDTLNYLSQKNGLELLKHNNKNIVVYRKIL